MAQTSMTVRIDSQQKAMFDSLCEQFGMSANAAINVFVKAVIRTRSIPFAIKAKESKEDKVTDEAIEAFENMCKTARENNIEMSLDEINAEIKEVRRLRKNAMVYAVIDTNIFVSAFITKKCHCLNTPSYQQPFCRKNQALIQ